MEVRNFREYCKKKSFYVVKEEGWYYSSTAFLTDSREEAIAFWEKATGRKFNEYSEYVKTANTTFEGFWYYSFSERNYADFIDGMIKDAVRSAREQYAEEIAKQGNQKIADAATQAERKRGEEIMKGLMYYLSEQYWGLTFAKRDEQKRCFEKYNPGHD